jgi:hypothetical protein
VESYPPPGQDQAPVALLAPASKVPWYRAGEPGSPNQMVSSRSVTSYTYSRMSPVLPK